MVPNILSFGDIGDVARLISPRALYISATTDDKYSKGADELFEYCAPTFPDSQLKLKFWSGGHVFTEEMRKEAYSFLLSKL